MDMQTSPRGIFITGTDTDAGKTVVTAALALHLTSCGYRTGVMKPVASGVEPGNISEDTRLLLHAAGAEDSGLTPQQITPITLREPLSPHMAARLEKKALTPESIRAAVLPAYQTQLATFDRVLVEGVGGALVPLADRYTIADLAAELSIPAVIVTADRLGCINHTLLTIEALQRREIPILGVILNRTARPDLAAQTNEEALAHATDIPVWGTVPFCPADTDEKRIRQAATSLGAIMQHASVPAWLRMTKKSS